MIKKELTIVEYDVRKSWTSCSGKNQSCQDQEFMVSRTQLFFAVEPEVACHDYELAEQGDPEQRQSHWTP